MKKITLMCSLALLASQTAFAEVGDKITSLDQLKNDKVYTITPKGGARGTWCYDESNPDVLTSTTRTGDEINMDDPNQQFAFIKSESGRLFIYSVGAQKFFSKGEKKVLLVDKITDENAIASILNSTNADKANFPWVVAINGSQLNLCNPGSQDAYGVVLYDNLGDDGNSICLTEAGTFDDASEATDKIKKFETYYTEENIALANEANNVFKTPQRAVGGYDPTLWGKLNDLCGGDAKADIYDVIKEGFQEALTDVQNSTSAGITFSNDKVYKIQNLSASNGYLYSKEEETASRIFTSAKQNDLTPVANSEYWQVGTANGYTVLYNQGTNSYAQYDAANNYWVLSKDPTFMNIQSNPSKSLAAFTIQDTRYTGNQQYMHISIGYETGVVVWSTDADATNFYFVEQPDVTATQIDIESIVLEMKRDEARTIIDGYDATKSNYLGSYSSESINSLKTLLEESTTSFEALEAGIEAVQNSAKQPESGKYYTIQSAMVFNDATTKAIYENPDGTNIAWHTASQAPAELWQFEPDGSGHYYIKSANTGKYLQLNPGAGSGTLVAEQGSAFTLEQKDNSITLALINYTSNDKATLVLQTSNSWGSTAKPENESGNYVGTYNGFGDAMPTTWNVIEATNVKLNIGDAKYATTWLPFAINLSGTNVEAYTVSNIDNGIATLEKIENIIPAQTAVVLHGESSNYSFNIESENNQEAISSKLQGTAIATAIDVNSNAYILANGKNGIGFYLLDDTERTVAANKAYLVVPAAEASGIKAFTFDFGGTTGIESTEATVETAEEYYDLQGRRVANPTKGIYVTKSGKKVLFTK